MLYLFCDVLAVMLLHYSSSVSIAFYLLDTTARYIVRSHQGKYVYTINYRVQLDFGLKLFLRWVNTLGKCSYITAGSNVDAYTRINQGMNELYSYKNWLCFLCICMFFLEQLTTILWHAAICMFFLEQLTTILWHPAHNKIIILQMFF